MLARVFFMGIILAPVAVIAQWLFREIIINFNPAYDYSNSISFFLWAAFVEEVIKFLAVEFIVLRNTEFDEPTDAMIYMIAAGLGFAAIENTLALFQSIPNGLDLAFKMWSMRFVGATLLHAISSAMTGYFVALSWFYHKHTQKIIPLGIALATLIHFVFNILIYVGNGDSSSFLFSTVFLMVLAVLISHLFNKLKNRVAPNLPTHLVSICDKVAGR